MRVPPVVDGAGHLRVARQRTGPGTADDPCAAATTTAATHASAAASAHASADAAADARAPSADAAPDASAHPTPDAPARHDGAPHDDHRRLATHHGPG